MSKQDALLFFYYAVKCNCSLNHVTKWFQGLLLPLLPLNHFSPHLRQLITQQLERWTPYSCTFILFIIRARWLSLAWQDVQNNVSYAAALKEKYCLNWECFLAVTSPSAPQPASSSCEEAPGLRIHFFLFCLSPPAGEYLEVLKSYSLLLNTNLRGATTAQLLESRVCPSIGMENYKHRHLRCKWHKLEHVSSAVANLGISEELKAKLQDVMVARSLLSIGKVLGEGGCITSGTVIIKLF